MFRTLALEDLEIYKDPQLRQCENRRTLAALLLASKELNSRYACPPSLLSNASIDSLGKEAEPPSWDSRRLLRVLIFMTTHVGDFALSLADSIDL